jgi:hypothetical protein
MKKRPIDELPDISYYAFDARAKTAEKFRGKNADLVEDTLSELNRLYAAEMACVIYGADVSGAPRFDAFALFVRALEALVSSLHLASHRQAGESLVLMRLSLESAATAAHICSCEKALAQYCKFTYKSTSAISNAKKIVPIIGELWGGISTIAVHVNLAHGPFYQPSEDGEGVVGTIEVPLAEKRSAPGQDETLLTLISLIANIDLRLFEETLLEKSPTYDGWLQVPGTQHAYVCPTEELIRKYHDKFVRMPDFYRAEASNPSPDTTGA